MPRSLLLFALTVCAVVAAVFATGDAEAVTRTVLWGSTQPDSGCVDGDAHGPYRYEGDRDAQVTATVVDAGDATADPVVSVTSGPAVSARTDPDGLVADGTVVQVAVCGPAAVGNRYTVDVVAVDETGRPTGTLVPLG